MVLTGFFIPAPLIADSLLSDFLIIDYLDMKREKNGRTSQRFRLVCGDYLTSAVNLYYWINREKMVYRAEVVNSEFTISVHQPSIIHLVAMANTRQTTYIAKTDLTLFGKADTAPMRQTSSQIKTGFPYIELTSPQYNYWPQTGQNFRFSVNAPFDTGGVELFVWVNGGYGNLESDGNSKFSYVPSHDLRLRKTGHLATRRDILFSHISSGDQVYRLTYTLALHRSRDALNVNLAGWVAFGLSFLLFGGLIMIKRRKSQW